MGSSGDTAHVGTAHDIRRQLSTVDDLAVIGSSSFWHQDSSTTCRQIGQKLANLSSLSIITGGMEGAGETVARSFSDRLPVADVSMRILHLLPVEFDPTDYGKTIFVGEDVAVRREVLGRVSNLYLVIEGGPGTEHEAAVAMAQDAALLPVGRSGGCAAQLYSQLQKPNFAAINTWQTLGDAHATPDAVADAIYEIVQAFFRQS
jgi:hypothetical protein